METILLLAHYQTYISNGILMQIKMHKTACAKAPKSSIE
jgi:hypothetical protein